VKCCSEKIHLDDSMPRQPVLVLFILVPTSKFHNSNFVRCLATSRCYIWFRIEKNWSIYEQETLALVESLKKFRHYVEGNKVNLFTDHKPLIYLNNQPKLTAKQARWVSYLNLFNYTIKYREGSSNKVPASFIWFLTTLLHCLSCYLRLLIYCIPGWNNLKMFIYPTMCAIWKK